MEIINYIDERWLLSLLDNINSGIIDIDDYLDFIDSLKEKISKEKILISADIYEKTFSHGHLYDLLWGDLSRHEDYRDTLKRLAVTLSESNTFDVKSSNQLSDAQIALMTKSFGGLIYNKVDTLTWWNPECMVLIDNNIKIKELYRKLCLHHKLSYDDFKNHLENCFPDLYFMEDAKDFSKTCIQEKNDSKLALIIEHLSYLNDYAQRDYLNGAEEFESKARQHNINLSRESSSTKAKPAAMKERIKKIGESDLLFELHTKLSWDKGRIHFHIGTNLSEGVLKMTNGRIIIGIICKHLTT
ncbi:hypothetical protein SMTE5_30950 [Serratia marcescens]|nr:hypothetical protein SMTE5_30950 [Serratia marcescens]